MTLTYATSFDGPLLVDCMRLFVEPECFVVQIWCSFWCERTFLFFDEEFFEDLKREIKKEKVSPTTKVNFSKHIEVSDTESVDNSNGLNKSSGKINQRTKVKIEVKIKESNRL